MIYCTYLEIGNYLVQQLARYRLIFEYEGRRIKSGYDRLLFHHLAESY